MVLRDVVSNDGHIWLKSEWGPASQEWPALSFSKRAVGEFLRGEFKPGRDVLLYVGTGNEFTQNPDHRRRAFVGGQRRTQPNPSHSRLRSA